MKSYVDHLYSTSFKNKSTKIFRSSAIFPFLLNKHLDCKIKFLSYWFLKKKIKEINFIYTLRDQKGVLIFRDEEIINSTKTYEISIKNLINRLKKKKNLTLGSIEIEFFSSRNLVFPYPAVIINYSSASCDSYVHSCGRIYNNHEDKIENIKNIVPETGFDISPRKDFKPFFAFVNGTDKLNKEIIKLIFINNDGRKKIKYLKFKNIREFESKFIFFLNQKEKAFFNGKKGTVKIFHNFKSFYPRFLCGNMKTNKKALSLTHTYYDLSENKHDDKLWLNPRKEAYFDSIISFPYFHKNNLKNELSFFPNFLKNSKFQIVAQLLDNYGKVISEKQVLFLDKKFNYFENVNFNKIFNDISKDLNKSYFVRLNLFSRNGVPTRFKVAYNLINKESEPSTNICFNSILPNHATLEKKGTFKWCAIIDPLNSIICISNISFLKNKFKDAKVDLKIWSIKKNVCIKKKLHVKNNGNVYLDFRNNKKIIKFLDNKSGWITMQSDNPFLNGFYFDFNSSGSVSGDHFF